MDPLFKAAIDYAIQSGRIKNPQEVSEERSRNTGKSFVLAKSDGTVLARIEVSVISPLTKTTAANTYNSTLSADKQQPSPTESKRHLTTEEHERATYISRIYGKRPPSIDYSEVLGDSVILRDAEGKHLAKYPASFLSAEKGLKFSDRSKAAAWARSVGYPVPEQPNGCLSTIAIIIGMFIFIVPGLMIIIWVAYNNKVYNREMDALVARWIDAGRPEPGVKSNIDNKIAAAEASMSTAEQLEEYKRMHEQGLISTEEHESLRKKVLDL